jgi:hypothetical protein
MVKLFSMADKPSTHIKKIYGDIGSPWHSPRDREKQERSSLFTLTKNLTEETHFKIKLTIGLEKPSLSIIAFRKGYSARS